VSSEEKFVCEFIQSWRLPERYFEDVLEPETELRKIFQYFRVFRFRHRKNSRQWKVVRVSWANLRETVNLVRIDFVEQHIERGSDFLTEVLPFTEKLFDRIYSVKTLKCYRSQRSVREIFFTRTF
jgi:hypothetical protein